MRVKHEALFYLDGIQLGDNGQPSRIIALPEVGAVAAITTTPANLARRIDEAAVLKEQLLSARIGEATSEAINERCRARQGAWPNAVFLHVVIETDGREIKDGAARRDFSNFSIALDALDVDAVRARREPAVDSIVSALRMRGHPLRPRLIGDVTYKDELQPTYYFQCKFGEVDVRDSRPLKDLTEIEGLATKLIRDGRLTSLLADAYTMEDQFRAFTSAWLGLEQLAHSNFASRYRAQWDQHLRAGGDDLPPEFLNKEKRRDKYTVAGKFRIIALLLSPQTADRDTDEFRELQEARIEGVHIEGPRAERWPVARARALLERYILLHADHQAHTGPAP
jgi:hypothetical protein